MKQRQPIEPASPLGFSIRDLWDQNKLSGKVKQVIKEVSDDPLEKGDAVQEE